MTEREIIQGLREGNMVALDEVFDRMYTQLCYCAFKIVNDSEDARDLVMDAFVKLAIKKENFNDLQHVQNYLYKIIERACISHLRSGKVRTKYKEQMAKQGHPLTENAIEKTYQQSDQIIRLFELVNNLPDRMQQAFKLAYIEGYRREEIAGMMNISENTVRNMLEKAKEIIRNAFTERNALIACYLISYYFPDWR
jgi:RNA polymerase sigma-70 factor (family 1)